MLDIADGTSYPLLVGERPPAPDLFWGWWSWATLDSALGVRDTWAVYPISGTKPPIACASLFPENYRSATSGSCDTHHFWSLHPDGGKRQGSC
jgi:hypothetical protein